ncbi:MAG: hypothetical protein KBA46_01145 [Candidatus Omnitrophica bacterium]|nr:hypothetical protein [Candidatus Omnitrophota bacterium]
MKKKIGLFVFCCLLTIPLAWAQYTPPSRQDRLNATSERRQKLQLNDFRNHTIITPPIAIIPVESSAKVSLIVKAVAVDEDRVELRTISGDDGCSVKVLSNGVLQGRGNEMAPAFFTVEPQKMYQVICEIEDLETNELMPQPNKQVYNVAVGSDEMIWKCAYYSE